MTFPKKLFILPLVCSLFACSNNNPPEPVVESVLFRTTEGALAQDEMQAIQVTATIDRIDYAKRNVTVKDSSGRKYSFDVSEEVKRLKDMKAGDKVVVDYMTGLAFEVRPVTAEELKNPSVIVESAAKTGKGLPPGVTAGSIVNTIVTVKEINLEQETISLALQDGEIVTIKARYPENLKRIKVGDTIVATFTESVAINIQPK